MSVDEFAPSDDLVSFADDAEAPPLPGTTPHCWRVLVVDDDDDVHRATAFALRGVKIFERPLQLLHARSGAEAWELVRAHPDIAVGLIDVVMETPDAGLELVRALREKGYREIRLVLRTGQPGYAPELAVISAYEIDDYRTKDEITQTRLITVLTGAIRSFEHLRRISHNRVGLELIVKSANRLFQRTNFELFCQGVLTQVASLVGVEAHGLVCAKTMNADGVANCRVVSAVGRLAHTLGKSIDESLDPAIAALCRDPNQPNPIFRDGGIAFHFTSSVEGQLFVYVEAKCEVAEEDVSLLALFSTNIAIAFENLSLIARLDRLAYIDPILEIPNLNAFEAALEVQRAKRTPAARMALMSVDSYDSIVAVHGPHTAHLLLRAVYRTLMEDGGEGLIAARIGDDTFALLGDPESLDAGLVGRAIAKPYTIEGIEIAVSATATLINLADVATDPAEAMRSASSALLHVERTHRGQVLPYNTSMRADVDRRFGLLTALRRVVNSGEGLWVALQPKVHLGTRRVVGAEALLRWTRDGEAISPAEFIPIAESGGLTQALTDFVVDAVGRWTRARTGQMPLPIAINLSMADLNNPGFARRLLTRVADAELTPETVEFEVTEGVVMQNAMWAISQLQALKSEGFKIALDDFGSGYSSLGYFDRLPIDTLKIDRVFITPLTVATARHSLAAIAVNMASIYNVGCVAEGVETAEQCQILEFLGCPVAQGFFLGRPIPIGEFAAKFLEA
jgi:EAL domain-containing protein (putative c-di-GMP-specific phosphodiesterase class I)/GGDEF domain-containing protein